MTMDNERRLLSVHLKRLRLPAMPAEYEKLSQEAAQENAHYLSFSRTAWAWGSAFVISLLL